MQSKLIRQLFVITLYIINRMESSKTQKKVQTQQKSFILSNKKDLSCVKVTNITFTKEDISEIDFLFNIRKRPSFSIKGQQSNPNFISIQNFGKTIANKEATDEPCPKRYHKCSRQTKISQMFFVRSINLQNKPTPVRLLSNIHNLNGENKQNRQKDVEGKGKENRRISRQIEHKKILGSNLISSASAKHINRKDFERKSTLQPLNGLRNQNQHLISNSVVELKKSTCIVLDSSNQKKNRNSQSQQQKNIDRIQTQYRQLKEKQRQTSSPKVSINFAASNLKDSLLEGKLIKYWEDLEDTARLHKMQINILDYQKTPIKFYVGKGNNSRLIKQVMKKRWWWGYSDEKNSSDVYFVWLQLKDKTFYKKIEQLQQELNQSENIPSQNTKNSNRKHSSKSSIQNQNQKCITNSTFSTHNIMTDSGSSCQNQGDELSQKERIAKILNEQIVRQKISSSTQRVSPIIGKTPEKDNQNISYSQRYNNTDCGLIQSSSSFYQGKTKNISPNKKGNYSPSKKANENYQIQPFCATMKNKPIRPILSMHNHYQHNQFLGNKKALYYCMKKYYKSTGQNVFDFLPLTFHVQLADQRDQQFGDFKRVYHEQLNKNKRKKLWILKPGQNSNRGKGITIHSDFEQIVKLIESTVGDKKETQAQKQSQTSEQKNQQNSAKRTFIIQQYIEKPFLYNKRKFDIRCYIMLTSLNGSIKGYWYRQGYIRTSCFQFTLDSYSNSFVHLTNDAIQKNCEQYGKYEQGNKLSYQTFKRYLAFKYQKSKKHDFDTQVYDKIRNVAIDSIKASYHMLDNRKMKSMHSASANHTVFEIFGLDFMIDENFQPWLIQVNTNPCLETSCPVLEKIIPKMVDDAFKLSVDVMYPPPADWPSSKKHLLGGIGSNGFELVFDEQAYTSQLKKMGKQMVETSTGSFRNISKMYEMQGIGQIQEDDEIYEQQQEE